MKRKQQQCLKGYGPSQVSPETSEKTVPLVLPTNSWWSGSFSTKHTVLAKGTARRTPSRARRMYLSSMRVGIKLEINITIAHRHVCLRCRWVLSVHAGHASV